MVMVLIKIQRLDRQCHYCTTVTLIFLLHDENISNFLILIKIWQVGNS